MTDTSTHFRRRTFLTLSAALLGSSAVPAFAVGQTPAPAPAAAPAAPAAAPAAPAPMPFSFDILSDMMRQKAKNDFTSAEIQLPPFIAGLTYDEYQHIQYRPDHARWSDPGSLFRVNAFHMGWLFKEPVFLYEVQNGAAQRLDFTTGDFNYYNPAIDQLASGTALPGIAGFRLNFPINSPDRFDELVAFQGASYFRALGRGSDYGLSARGLSINTGTAQPEEFPRFSDFYLEKQPPGSRITVVNAALDSQSVTGAYRFEVIPGDATVMNVTIRLFFRKDVADLGIAPLTSMFLLSNYNAQGFDDYRPEVHDSDGLLMKRGDGEQLWRPLNNPPALANSYFDDTSPKAFGLMQRQRSFEGYQDASAHYEHRPSVLVEPIGDWGKGTIRLVELPSKFEYNDNIVALWRPETAPKAGEMHEFSYRLSWGDLPPDPGSDLAFVSSMRLGHGGNAIDASDPNVRKFVVDFRGGLLASLADDAKITAVTTVTGGTIVQTAVFKVGADSDWRLIIDVRTGDGKLVEINAHLAGFEQRLSETWLYQWRVA